MCVKAIAYADARMAARLVEWIELQRLVGVHRIFMDYSNVAEEVLAALEHYRETGFVRLTEYVWAGPYSRWEKTSISLKSVQVT